MATTHSGGPQGEDLPTRPGRETSGTELDAKPSLLAVRSAVIFGSSAIIAVIAGVLALLALGHSTAGLAGSALTAGAAFAGAIRLLKDIVA